jgi:dTDP-4-amino-4,6-dideoxygalactose transaminase
VPPVAPGAEHVYHQYTIRVTDEVAGGRDGLAERLKERGIGTGMYYPIPIHRLPSFQRDDVASRVAGELTETERAAREALSLPIMPTLSQDELERIVAGVNAL